MKIRNFSSFTAALLDAGFSMGGVNNEGIFSLRDQFDSNIAWHTGDAETDPWEWRMRVLDERDDIAYAKLFFRKSGFITRQWYPYFLTVRRGQMSFAEEYHNGKISNEAKRIYEAISEHGNLPLHIIKQLIGFNKDEKSRFERALADLQVRMYITMCGRQRKVSQQGAEYGWSSTVFCTSESFFGTDVSDRAAHCSEQEAMEKIRERIYQLNPVADEQKVIKFIKG